MKFSNPRNHLAQTGPVPLTDLEYRYAGHDIMRDIGEELWSFSGTRTSDFGLQKSLNSDQVNVRIYI